MAMWLRMCVGGLLFAAGAEEERPALLEAVLDRGRLHSSCRRSRPEPYFGRQSLEMSKEVDIAKWRYRADDGHPSSSSSTPPRFVVLWGKFGLLNNRLRCLANALAWAGRMNATVVLGGPWEMFAAATLDVEWLLESSPADVLIVVGNSEPRWYKGAVKLGCTEAFNCGGPCNNAAASDLTMQSWGVPDWRSLRAGGQDWRVSSLPNDGALCGYAALAPRPEVRARALEWGVGWDFTAHHQRLETTVRKEPVSKMCFSAAKRILATYYGDDAFDAVFGAVCQGDLRPEMLRAASKNGKKIFLASDRFEPENFERWQSDRGVLGVWASEAASVAKWRGPSPMFDTVLGNALYAPSFAGGPQARRASLAKAVQPVLVDMLLLTAAKGDFWPTPGSTMSQTACYWRRAWDHPNVLPRIRTCDEICVVRQQHR